GNRRSGPDAAGRLRPVAASREPVRAAIYGPRRLASNAGHGRRWNRTADGAIRAGDGRNTRRRAAATGDCGRPNADRELPSESDTGRMARRLDDADGGISKT